MAAIVLCLVLGMLCVGCYSCVLGAALDDVFWMPGCCVLDVVPVVWECWCAVSKQGTRPPSPSPQWHQYGSRLVVIRNPLERLLDCYRDNIEGNRRQDFARLYTKQILLAFRDRPPDTSVEKVGSREEEEGGGQRVVWVGEEGDE